MVIDVHLKNKESFTNVFNDKELNPELGNYIFHKALIYKLTKKLNLKINIKTDFEVSEDDKGNIIDMIRSYYGHLVKTEMIYLNINNLKSVFLLIIGILILFVAYFVKGFVIHEIFVIIGWLVIGEAVYSVLFANRKRQRRKHLLKKLTTCYIEINQ